MNARFSFGGWTANMGALTLATPGRVVKVEPKAMAVLEVLARNAPEVVSKEQILDSVWAGSIVGDNALHRAISLLRQSLGDDTRKPRFIESVPRSGYRLPFAVRYEDGDRDPAVSPSPTASLGQLVVAVVGVPNSADDAAEVAELCRAVSRHLVWTSRCFSVVRPAAAAEIALHHVIEIRLEQHPDGLGVVSWDLWDGPSGVLLAASQYRAPDYRSNRTVAADLVVRAMIIAMYNHHGAVLDETNDRERLSYWKLIVLADRYRSLDPEAMLTRASLLRRAIADHPRQAPAYAVYANFRSWQIAHDAADEPVAVAAEAAEAAATAVGLDAGDPFVLSRCGSAFSRLGDYERGVELCRRAYDLAPSLFTRDLLARSLTYAGRADAAIDIYEDILASVGDAPVLRYGRVLVPFVQAGRFDEAMRYSDLGISHPASHYFCWLYRANLLALRGARDEAHAALQRCLRLIPGVSVEQLIARTVRNFGHEATQRENLTKGLQLLAADLRKGLAN